jgi:hypothetical protein
MFDLWCRWIVVIRVNVSSWTQVSKLIWEGPR